MSDSQPKKDLNTRRKLLKTITFSGGAAAALKGLPDDWKLPVVESVVLPAHAQSSFPATCSIPFSLTASGTPGGDPGIANVYTGTQSAGGPFRGDCRVAGFSFSEQPLVVTITSEGGGMFRVNYNLNSGSFIFEFVTGITELMTGFMGSGNFQYHTNRNFNLSGFPAHEETTYDFSIGPSPNGILSVQIDGLIWVNESAGP